MKAKMVFEFFDREDPNILRKIGLGKKSWHQLKPGDILIPAKEFKVVKDKFKPPSYKGGMAFYPEDFVVIYKIRRAAVWFNSYMRNGYAIGLHKCWDAKEAAKVQKIVRSGDYVEPDSYNKRPVEATDQQWKNRFNIYES